MKIDMIRKGDCKDSFLFEGDEAEILPLILLYRVKFNSKQILAVQRIL
jgi:hypothetical protein